MEGGELLRELEMIIQLHNAVRTTLCPQPSSLAHFSNENTLIRFAALLEANGNKPSTHLPEQAPWPEICQHSLFFFRNAILHEAHGHLYPDKIRNWERVRLCYDAFCHHVPDAKVDEGQCFRLDADRVLTPLFNGCLEYVRSLVIPGWSEAAEAE